MSPATLTPVVAVPIADAHAGKDRRRSARRPQACDAFVSSPTATDPDERWEVRAVNLSRHGLAFCSPATMPPGGYFKIDVGLGPQRLVCEVRVTHCRPAAGGQFEVGAEFV